MDLEDSIYTEVLKIKKSVMSSIRRDNAKVSIKLTPFIKKNPKVLNMLLDLVMSEIKKELMVQAMYKEPVHCIIRENGEPYIIYKDIVWDNMTIEEKASKKRSLLEWIISRKTMPHGCAIDLNFLGWDEDKIKNTQILTDDDFRFLSLQRDNSYLKKIY